MEAGAKSLKEEVLQEARQKFEERKRELWAEISTLPLTAEEKKERLRQALEQERSLLQQWTKIELQRRLHGEKAPSSWEADLELPMVPPKRVEKVKGIFSIALGLIYRPQEAMDDFYQFIADSPFAVVKLMAFYGASIVLYFIVAACFFIFGPEVPEQGGPMADTSISLLDLPKAILASLFGLAFKTLVIALVAWFIGQSFAFLSLFLCFTLIHSTVSFAVIPLFFLAFLQPIPLLGFLHMITLFLWIIYLTLLVLVYNLDFGFIGAAILSVVSSAIEGLLLSG